MQLRRMRNDKDGFETMRAIVGSLAAKARLHVIACLRANNINNLHSLAVQMRPMLECAGQIRVYMEGILSKRIEAIAGPESQMPVDFHHQSQMGYWDRL